MHPNRVWMQAGKSFRHLKRQPVLRGRREKALMADLRNFRVLAYVSAADRVPPYAPQQLGPVLVRTVFHSPSSRVLARIESINDVRMIKSMFSLSMASMAHNGTERDVSAKADCADGAAVLTWLTHVRLEATWLACNRCALTLLSLPLRSPPSAPCQDLDCWRPAQHSRRQARQCGQGPWRPRAGLRLRDPSCQRP